MECQQRQNREGTGMSDKENVPDQGLVTVECGGYDCEEVFQVLVGLPRCEVSVTRVQCPGCGRDLDIRAAVYLEIFVESERRLPDYNGRVEVEDDVRKGDVVYRDGTTERKNR